MRRVDTTASLLIVNKAADDLANFSKGLEAHTKIFSEAYKRAVDAFHSALTISKDFSDKEHGDKVLAEKAVDDLLASIKDARSQCAEFQATLSKLPSMLSQFNKAKRDSVKGLGDLLAEFDGCMDLFRVVKTMIADA
jgi:soluble cytochrome b562